MKCGPNSGINILPPKASLHIGCCVKIHCRGGGESPNPRPTDQAKNERLWSNTITSHNTESVSPSSWQALKTDHLAAIIL